MDKPLYVPPRGTTGFHKGIPQAAALAQNAESDLTE